tara:strand:+ start:240 stop:1379 length:1140 start_codon:yes stop_codon:yes gene_type:complete
MYAMFYGCTSLTSVPLFDTSGVTAMGYMFAFCTSLTTVPLFDTSGVTAMGSMFQNCTSLTTVPLLNVALVNSFGFMFFNSTLTTASYSAWLVHMESTNPLSNEAFHGGSSLYDASASTARASLVTRGWTITDGGPAPTYYSAEYLLLAETVTLPFTLNGHTTDWGDGTVNALDTHTYASGGTYTITSTGADVTDLLYDGHALAPKLLRVLDGSAINMTNMFHVFEGCTSLTTVALFDISGIASLGYMFRYCSSLTSVPLFDTSSVTLMFYMFYGCTSLTTVPLFDTSSVTNMYGTFNGCSSLTTVPLLDVALVNNFDSMFSGVTLSTASYSAFLVHLESTNALSNEAFHGGNSLYDSSATTARASLVTRGWTITDGGLA